VDLPYGTTEHPINKSGKRKILVSVHPQSERSYYLCNDHPAKMRLSLARAILQLYSHEYVLVFRKTLRNEISRMDKSVQ